MNRWHTLLALLGALVLLTPMAAVWTMVRRGTSMQRLAPEGVRLVPVLSDEERRQRATWHHPCREDAECEAPLVCFFNSRSSERYCSDSTCLTDAQCPGGFACRTVPAARQNTSVQVCTQVGVRKEGEECVLMPSTPNAGCEWGLLCSGRCGRPCQRDVPASCPQGFFCADGLQGPSCLPTCEGRACPEGQQCVSLGKGASLCAYIHGEDCQRQSCADGQRCVARTRLGVQEHVWMECVQPCGDERAPCPEGFRCLRQECRQRCDPDASDTCGPWHRCRSLFQHEPPACLPQLRVP